MEGERLLQENISPLHITPTLLLVQAPLNLILTSLRFGRDFARLLEGSRWPVSTCWMTSHASSVHVRGDSRGRRGRRPWGPRAEASALVGARGSDPARGGRTPSLQGESVFPGASPALGGTRVPLSSCGVRAPCPRPRPRTRWRSLCGGASGAVGPPLVAQSRPCRVPRARRRGEGREGHPLQGVLGRHGPGPSPVPPTCLSARGKEATGRARKDRSAVSNLLLGDSPGTASRSHGFSLPSPASWTASPQHASRERRRDSLPWHLIRYLGTVLQATRRVSGRPEKRGMP